MYKLVLALALGSAATVDVTADVKAWHAAKQRGRSTTGGAAAAAGAAGALSSSDFGDSFDICISEIQLRGPSLVEPSCRTASASAVTFAALERSHAQGFASALAQCVLVYSPSVSQATRRYGGRL